mmetsp:Transcript_31348/g.70828  ORF Transcript_31348/g.70828 Transcript_31348/m.70828 type:complete len:201 (-) Transcript_31348:348-950(-)
MGVLLHNVGSCLHHLGDFDIARAHYEQALKAFERAAAGSTSASPEDVLLSRMRFVRRRLREVEEGQLPDAEAYLDGAGQLRRDGELEVPRETVQEETRVMYYDDDDEGVERYSADEDEAVQEAARREWLEYYHKVSDWKRASDLVVTADEYDDLVYLIEHQRRHAQDHGLEWDESLIPYGVGSSGGYEAFLRARGIPLER